MTDSHKRQPTGPDPSPDSEAEERDDAVIGRAFLWSSAVILLLAAVGGGAAYFLRPQPEPVETTGSESVEAKRREPPTVEIPEVPFLDMTKAAGIDFVHENGAAGQKLFPETMGGGCAFLDFDSDGDQDILFVNSQRWPGDTRPAGKPATLALYRNDGAGRFEDVTADSGLAVSLYGMGAAVGDFNNDGFVDVYVTAVGPNWLFLNTGFGTFADVSDERGVAGADQDPNEWSTSSGWFDFDNDGDLDLFVCTYVVWNKEYDLSQDFRLTGVGRAYGQPQKFEGTFSRLYRNDGDGTFADVSAVAGIQVRSPDTGVPMGKSLGISFADFDRDGFLDIVVANDTVQNFYFQNQRDGTFREMGAATGVAFDPRGNARGAMGIDVARFRNNDEIGIAIGNFANEMTALYVSRDGTLFTDEAVSNGIGPVTRQELTFGLFFFDCDLDGRLDLFAANGHLESDIEKGQARQRYQQPPQLLWNCGPQHRTEFVQLPAEKCGTDFTRPMVGRGAAYADIDGDGDLDALIVGSGQPPRLLWNNQRLGRHWLRVKLIGTKSNRDAIGSWIEVHAGGKIYRQQVMPTRSYLSQVELPATFGLGSDSEIDRVTIRWASGNETALSGLPIDRLHVVHEDAAAGGTDAAAQ